MMVKKLQCPNWKLKLNCPDQNYSTRTKTGKRLEANNTKKAQLN
jgi:hypothetical protein